MADWLSYSLSDVLLFSNETYHRLFGLANRALWPAHVASLVAAAAIVALLRRGGTGALRGVAALLSCCWLFVAVAWHLVHYATINWAATWFAAGFASQSLLLAWTAARPGRMASAKTRSGTRAAGWVIVLFAFVGYPLLAPLSGRPFSEAEVFVIAPDPTVAATLGALVIAGWAPLRLFVLPVLWAGVSGATLWSMGAPDALLLPAIAVASLAFAVWGRVSPATRAP